MISCIVPVFNAERFLRQAVESILAQTYRPLEIIAIDDGSTDTSKAILSSYGDQVRYLWQPNAGPSTARNTGIRAAKGEFIAFLDADDLWHADKLARQVARLDARPELDVSVTLIQNFWMPELNEEQQRFREHRRGQALPGYSTVTMLARRQLFDRIGLFDSTLKHGDDTEWFMRAEEHGAHIELLSDILVYRRLHANNRSRTWTARSQTEYLMLLKKLVERRRAREQAASDDADRTVLPS
jgi:glycosyltransferase involved in cell wall biosynthesis